MRTPSRIDREFFVPAEPPYSIAGGPDFRAEELVAYELGYRGQLGSNLAVSISTFFHDYDDLRSLEPGLPAIIANGLAGRSYGAELAADYRLTPGWRVKAGYTELRVHSAPKAGSGDRTSTRSQSLDPNRQIVLHSQLDLPANTALDLSARYVARVSNQDVPGYAELDARISWRPTPRLELAVVGKNLLHARHPEFGAPATRREIPRSVNGTVRWTF
jgi:iron complex outermembrane receptor protein